MGAKLTVVAGPSRGMEVALAGRIIFNIGSDRGSSVFLDDARVAPNHCRLYNEESKFTLFDVSGKGMDVNGKRVVKAVLHDGDVIALGDTRLCFSAVAGGAAGPGPAGFAPPMAAPPMAAPPAAGDFQLDLRGGSPAASQSTGYARIWLKCVEGNDKGKTFDLSEGACWVLGRGHSADITVMDIKVSRAHTRIDRQGDAFFVSDLNSTNGSFVNGQQIERQQLQRGDYIKLGYTILSFQYETLEETGGQSGRVLDPAAVAGLRDDPFSRELGSASGGSPRLPGAPGSGRGLPSAPPFAPPFAGGATPFGGPPGGGAFGGGQAAPPPGFPPPGLQTSGHLQAPPGAPAAPRYAPPGAGAPPFPQPGPGGAPPFPPPGAGGAQPGPGGAPPFPPPGAGGAQPGPGGAPPFPPPGAGGAQPGPGGAPPFPPPGAGAPQLAGGPAPATGFPPAGGGAGPAPPGVCAGPASRQAGAAGPPSSPSSAALPPAAERPLGRTAPGMPSAGDFEDMKLDVSALDDADNLFAPASAGSGSLKQPPGGGAPPGPGGFPPPGPGGFPPPGPGGFPPPGPGGFPPPGPGGFPPPGPGGFPPPGPGGFPPPGSGGFPPPGSGGFPPPEAPVGAPAGAQASSGGRRADLQTRDLAVPDIDDDLFGAPPASASAPASDVQCFLCSRPFSGAEVAAGRVRKVQENYYCQECLGPR